MLSKKTASFFDITPPVSLSKIDEKIKDMNERLSKRAKELAEQDEIARQKRIEEKDFAFEVIIIEMERRTTTYTMMRINEPVFDGTV